MAVPRYRSGIMTESLILRNNLWKNARDSIRHAIDHFSNLRDGKADRDHHVKWAILSVHHSAECFCNMLLVALRQDLSSFQRKGKPWFPSLRDAVTQLTAPEIIERFSAGEQRLMELFRYLADTRDQIMHRALPDDMEASVAAMSLLGLLRIARRRTDEGTSDMLWRSSPVEIDVFDAIRYTRVEEYCRFAEQLIREEYPDRYLPLCPNCQTESIVDSHCEVCFEKMDSIECPESGERVFYPSWRRHAHERVDIECPHCGETHTA
jgi:hypothetical protein